MPSSRGLISSYPDSGGENLTRTSIVPPDFNVQTKFMPYVMLGHNGYLSEPWHTLESMAVIFALETGSEIFPNHLA